MISYFLRDKAVAFSIPARAQVDVSLDCISSSLYHFSPLDHFVDMIFQHT